MQFHTYIQLLEITYHYFLHTNFPGVIDISLYIL